MDPHDEQLGFEAIVFDLDGVLINSETIFHRTWVEVFADHGASFTNEEWCSLIGTRGHAHFDPYGALAERSTRPVAAREEIIALIRAREVPEVDASGPMPGVIHWLDAATAAGIPLAVATSSSRSWLESRLAAIGIDRYFQVTVTPEDGFAPKPAPDLYLAACRLLDVAPERSLAIEDSVNGMTAALAAGMTCLAVPTNVTSWMDFSGAHHLATSLAELDFATTIEQLAQIVVAAQARASEQAG